MISSHLHIQMISTADCHLGTISKPRGGCRGSSVALAWLGKTGSLVRIAASGDNSGSWIYGAYHHSYQVVAGSFESSQGIAVARLSAWEHGESNNIYIYTYLRPNIYCTYPQMLITCIDSRVCQSTTLSLSLQEIHGILPRRS